MNKKNKRLLIFHIYRKDGSSFFLHPFEESDILLKLPSLDSIEGRYGKEPRVESLTLLRNQLYRLVEAKVKEWIQDTKFIPRFIIAAGAFLVAYFFTTFVIRDPIPIIDETVVSAITALIVYYWLSRRDQSSEKASEKRLELRRKVDGIIFTESAFIKEFEEILHANESVDFETLVNSMLTSEKSFMTETASEEAQSLLGYLEKMFSGKTYRKQSKILAKLSGSPHREKAVDHIVKWASNNKVDLSLFAVYRSIKSISPPDLSLPSPSEDK